MFSSAMSLLLLSPSSTLSSLCLGSSLLLLWRILPNRYLLVILEFMLNISSQHLEPGTEPFTPEQEFGEMTLSDYDSDEDADYEPSDSEGSSDDLEYDSGASVSSASEFESGDVSATE